MLQIDLKASKLNPKTMGQLTMHAEKASNPAGLNAYNSLNRANRIKDLAKIVDDNRRVLDRLQCAQSHYSTDKQTADFNKKVKIATAISQNTNRFQRNTYFLHSVCTQDAMPPPLANTKSNKRLQSAAYRKPGMLSNSKGGRRMVRRGTSAKELMG